jgi:hypothetical protein
MSREGQRRISVYIPEELFTQLENSGHTITDAVTTGLDLFLGREKETGTKQLEHEQLSSHELLMSYQARILSLEDQLKSKDSDYKERVQDLKEQLKNKDGQQDARINDLLDQLNVKDGQIKDLTSTMQSQAINIHDILNQKAIEMTGEKKKPWYKFW